MAVQPGGGGGGQGSQIELQLAEVRKINIERNFKLQAGKLKLQGDILNLQKIQATNEAGQNTDRIKLKSTLAQLSDSLQQRGQGGVIEEQLVGPATGGEATAGNPRASGTVDAIFKATNPEVTSTEQGGPTPTGRQGEVTRESTTTTTGGQGFKEAGAAAFMRLVGNAIPGKQGFLENAGTRTSTSRVTGLTPEFKESRQKAAGIIAVGTNDVLSGDADPRAHKALVDSTLSRFREPSDRKMILEGAQRQAVEIRQRRDLARKEVAEKQIHTLAKDGISISSNMATDLGSDKRMLRHKANEGLAQVMQNTPRIRKRWVDLDAAKITLEITETQSKITQMNWKLKRRQMATSAAEQNATTAKMKIEGEFAAANVLIPPKDYKPAQVTQSIEKLVGDAFSNLDTNTAATLGQDGKQIIGPGRAGSNLRSSHLSTPSKFPFDIFGLGDPNPKIYNDASILLDPRNRLAFRFNQEVQVRSGNPQVLHMKKEDGKMHLARLNSPLLQEYIDVLNGNRPMNKNGEFIETVTDGPLDVEQTRKHQQDIADKLRKNEVMIGMGIVPTQDKLGDWKLDVSDKSLNPELAWIYLNIGQNRNTAELSEGTRIFGPAR